MCLSPLVAAKMGGMRFHWYSTVIQRCLSPCPVIQLWSNFGHLMPHFYKYGYHTHLSPLYASAQLSLCALCITVLEAHRCLSLTHSGSGHLTPIWPLCHELRDDCSMIVVLQITTEPRTLGRSRGDPLSAHCSSTRILRAQWLCNQ